MNKMKEFGEVLNQSAGRGGGSSYGTGLGSGQASGGGYSCGEGSGGTAEYGDGGGAGGGKGVGVGLTDGAGGGVDGSYNIAEFKNYTCTIIDGILTVIKSVKEVRI